jgi:hypothetical protein
MQYPSAQTIVFETSVHLSVWVLFKFTWVFFQVGCMLDGTKVTDCNACWNTHGNALQHTATHCNTHCNMHCNTLQRTATHTTLLWRVLLHECSHIWVLKSSESPQYRVEAWVFTMTSSDLARWKKIQFALEITKEEATVRDVRAAWVCPTVAN